MAHDKPKVTIDLEEYAELLEKTKTVNVDATILGLKTVIASMVNNRMDMQRIRTEIDKKGILFSIQQNYTGREVLPEDILITASK